MQSCDGSKWVNMIRLTLEEGKLKHSGQKRPLKVHHVPGGVRIGCTFVSFAALDRIWEEAHG
jgi:hypothetical protein